MSQDDMRDYWDRYVEGWNDHDPRAVRDAFTSEGTIDAPTADEPMVGKEIEEWVEGLVDGFPDVTFEEHRVLSTDEDGVFVVEWTLLGTHTESFQGLPPTDNAVAVDGVDVATISEAGIESLTVYFDQHALMEQLGLTFPTILTQIPKLAVGAARNAF